MGLFDFVREAGERLGVVEDEKAVAAEEYAAEAKTAKALWQRAKDLGLGVEELQVTFDDGTATVYGQAPSQTAKEKVILAIGNTREVAHVDDRIEVKTPEPEATFYTVESGDTLSKISLEHYGDANAYMKIFEANQPLLKDPNLIYPGQVLRIPQA
ncbi:MAG: peptidoglycan-binding protein LysM [Gemmatimonadota bacterium]